MVFRKRRRTSYLFFAGKGGVGKTTIAAATALWFSENGRKTLIISTDPAHSLSDSFETRIGGDTIKLSKRLFAVEIDPKKAMSEYKEKFTPKIENIGMLKGMGIDEIFDTAGMTPGIDEISAFDKFLQYMKSEDYDVIVFDTAPTGHTLRFLSLPDVLDSWIGKMIKLRVGFSGIINVFRKMLPFGSEKSEPSLGTDEFDRMKERILSARKILSDPARTGYNMVMIPEDMSILESERSLDVLKQYNIPVKTIVVNQLLPENPGCKFCAEKRSQQQKKLMSISKRFSGLNMIQVPLFSKEIRGFSELRGVGEILYEKEGKSKE